MREKELFEYLKRYLTDLRLADDQYSKWDCVSDRHKFLIELKSRRTHYDTLLIEKIKYDSLLQRAEAVGYIPLYVNSTPKGVYSFRLNELELNWETNTKNPATSEFSNRLRVEKTVSYIPISKAKVIEYANT